MRLISVIHFRRDQFEEIFHMHISFVCLCRLQEYLNTLTSHIYSFKFLPVFSHPVWNSTTAVLIENAFALSLFIHPPIHHNYSQLRAQVLEILQSISILFLFVPFDSWIFRYANS